MGRKPTGMWLPQRLLRPLPKRAVLMWKVAQKVGAWCAAFRPGRGTGDRGLDALAGAPRHLPPADPSALWSVVLQAPRAQRTGLMLGPQPDAQLPGGGTTAGCLAASGLRALVSSPAGATWTAFDEPAGPTAVAPGVAMDVGSSVWAARAPSATALEEKGWAKFPDFQPFCW